MNLVYNGIPITGSWGGDCMQLAKAYYGQASDEAGYADVMRYLAKDDDGSVSAFWRPGPAGRTLTPSTWAPS